MSDPAAARPARLFTTFGTVLFVDDGSGELRHGPIESSPRNLTLVSGGSPGHARLLHGETAPLGLSAGVLRAGEAAGEAADLRIVPLERGLLGLRCDAGFVTAHPDGSVDGSRTWCSTWEFFLTSEQWCTREIDVLCDWDIDRPRLRRFMIDPRLRAKVNAESSATKVLIFGYPQWSHGRVYYDLCKHLHREGYIVDILNWRVNHAEYMHELQPFYDFFMTSPDGVVTLSDIYGVPADKMIVVSHHEMDIRMLVEKKGTAVFEDFASYGVVSYFVYCASLMQGVRRTPMVASLGINFEEFHAELPERLEAVGYASSMSATTFGVEWKRGNLAESATLASGLEFKVAGSTANQTSFHDMPDFYRTVGAVLTSSISEAAQLPVMEAAAAGRLVIGTPVGHFPLKAYQGGGILAPIEEEKFRTFCADTLRYYKEHPAEYVAKCRSIQDAARQFDWRYAIGDWVALIDAAKRRRKPGTPGVSIEPAADGDYEFSADWFSGYIPVWNQLLQQYKPARLLEIGSFEGRSTCYLIEFCSRQAPIDVHCIDNWQGGVEHDKNAMPEVERRFDRNIELAIARAHFPVALTKHKTSSLRALTKIVASGEAAFDFVYVDGSHQAPDVLTDAILAFQLLRVGGLMIFDDYLWRLGPDESQDPLNMPKPAIDSFINIFQRKLRILSGLPIYQLYIEKLFP